MPDIPPAETDAPKPSGARTRFKPGTSGNPQGRPKGTRASVYAELDAVAAEALPDVIAAIVTSARAGDARAAELLFRRAWPERKGRPLAFPAPTAAGAGGLVQAMEAVTAAMAAGEMTTEEASAVAGVLEIHRKVIAVEDHEARLRALEEGRK